MLETILSARSSGVDEPDEWMFEQLMEESAAAHQAGGRVYLYDEKLDDEMLASYEAVGLTATGPEQLQTVPAWSAFGAEFREINYLALRQSQFQASEGSER